MTPVLRCAGLTKQLGHRRVLNGIDFHVGAGETVALFGANGAGKSTFLRVIAGIGGRFGGRLELFGGPAQGVGPAVRRRVGLLGHQSFCYDVLSGLENLSLYAELYDLPQPRRLALDWLERVGLTLFAHEPVASYSRGMQQRLALARCLLPAPELLLLDEPTTGLDLSGVAMMREAVAEVRGRGGAVVLVTHDVDTGLTWADRAALLSRGKIVATAPTVGLDAAAWADVCRRAARGGGVL